MFFLCFFFCFHRAAGRIDAVPALVASSVSVSPCDRSRGAESFLFLGYLLLRVSSLSLVLLLLDLYQFLFCRMYFLPVLCFPPSLLFVFWPWTVQPSQDSLRTRL